MTNTARSAAIPWDGGERRAPESVAATGGGSSREELVPAALLAECGRCGTAVRRALLRDFGDQVICSTCFETTLQAAQQTKQALLDQLDEPGRLCSRCLAMTDRSVASPWCGVLELGDDRAMICDSFVLQVGSQMSLPASEKEHEVSADELWQSVSIHLAECLGPTHLSLLENTAAETYEGRVLSIAVPDEYTRSWLLARLGPAISNALDVIGYSHVEVQFITKTLPWRDEPKRAARKKAPQLPTIPLQPAPSIRRKADEEPFQGSRFGSKFTFDQFVVGTGNRLAHAGSLAVAEGSSSYNPLFIHGGVGVGKTHLLQAIGSRCSEQGRQALYVASETFTNDLICSIRNGSTAEFRHRYREIDVLLVDDIHFIIGKDSTQEEFFHTFNWLYDNGKQIVLSSDRAPRDMRVLDQRLRSRFWWGLTALIEPPDHETRVRILQQKSEARGKQLPQEVVEYLASQPTDNVRELEGLLNRLMALSELQQIDPLVALHSGLLHDQQRHREVDHSDILQAVSAYFHVSSGAICGQQRNRSVSLPRHIAMYLMREDGKMSLPRIGEFLGGRDHSTVIYGCDRVGREMRDRESAIRRDVDSIRTILFGS